MGSAIKERGHFLKVIPKTLWGTNWKLSFHNFGKKKKMETRILSPLTLREWNICVCVCVYKKPIIYITNHMYRYTQVYIVVWHSCLRKGVRGGKWYPMLSIKAVLHLILQKLIPDPLRRDYVTEGALQSFSSPVDSLMPTGIPCLYVFLWRKNIFFIYLLFLLNDVCSS